MVLLSGALLSGGPAVAEAGRIPTVTRLVQRFSDFEQQLASALKAGDAAAAGVLLDANFELQVAAGEADVVPRTAWLAASIKAAGHPGYTIANMAVRDFEPVALVTFDWLAPPGKRGARKAYFVTDVWHREGERWLLRLRIVAESRGAGVTYPGREVVPPVIEKKY